MDIADIYRLAFGAGTQPDAWQRRLAADEWPEILIAPTGSGKTAAVTLGWAARRMRETGATPRRLVWCLPMRTLVDQTGRAAREWFARLKAAGADERGALPGTEDVHILMGGVEAARWLDRPERPAIIVGTQDMLLSRALMRGYASSRANWPMEFALLHEDAQWVFDEVQLMGAGRATSAQLEAFRRCDAAQRDCPSGRPARSLWISATLDPKWLRTVDYSPPAPMKVDPRTEGGRLLELATARKSLRRSNAAPVSHKDADVRAYIAGLADSILDAHRPGHMTLAIVNRVKRAQALHAALGKKLKERGEAEPELALVHARYRPPDREREMAKLPAKAHTGGGDAKDLIVISTQAVEAGVDVSAAVLFTELAPWPSMVQRFGRANRYAEVEGGAGVYWIDLLGGGKKDDKQKTELSRPYAAEELAVARARLLKMSDASPDKLPPPGDIDPPKRVIRRKDLDDLFDTDPDLTGFDVDISAYVRDADDTDLHVFWRDLAAIGDAPPQPQVGELCTVSVRAARDWFTKVRMRAKEPIVFVRDPQWRRENKRIGAAPLGWTRLGDDPRPGLTLLADIKAGGYNVESGFTGDPADIPVPGALRDTQADASGEAEGYDEDPRSEIGVPVPLSAHLGHVAAEAKALCDALGVDTVDRAEIVRAARWHDLGKTHDVFQNTMRSGLDPGAFPDDLPLAKTVGKNLRHERRAFRHELASALAFLAHENWSRDADLVAYLVAAHHGKVRLNLRALPREPAPRGKDRAGARFARGIWEGDELRPFDLGGGERWKGGILTLSATELGFDEATGESWTERTRDLLARFGPFRLAWMETVVRIADWRASGKEREKRYDDMR